MAGGSTSVRTGGGSFAARWLKACMQDY